MQNRPFKRRQKQTPAYHRQYAYDDRGVKVMQAVMNEKGEVEQMQVYRDVPNRAMVRMTASKIRRGVS